MESANERQSKAVESFNSRITQQSDEDVVARLPSDVMESFDHFGGKFWTDVETTPFPCDSWEHPAIFPV